MVMPMIHAKQHRPASREDLKKKSPFGMFDSEEDEVRPAQAIQESPFAKKREAKADRKLGKLGSSKISKEKKVRAEPEVVEKKPLKFQKSNKLGLGLTSAPNNLFKPRDKKAERINALFGGKNPFEKLAKKQMTLIATPSKFEIRNDAPTEKRGRGRPRKDGGLGIRDKVANAKADGQPRGRGRPPKDPALKELSK